jgi:anthranilate/para-aminobenzoate synthase component I
MNSDDIDDDLNGAVTISGAPDLSTGVIITEKQPVYRGSYSVVYKGSYRDEEVSGASHLTG